MVQGAEPKSVLYSKERKNSPRLSTKKIKYTSSYNGKIESKSTFNGFTFNKEESFLSYGGFILQSPFNNLLDDFIDDNNIKEISVITADFALLNIELQQVINVVMTYQYDKIALGEYDFHLYYLNKVYYSNTKGKIEAVFEILYCVSLVVYLLFLLHDVRKRANANNKTNTSTSPFIRLIIEIIHDWLLLLHLCSFLLGIVGIVIWLYIIVVKEKNKVSIANCFKENSSYLTLKERNQILFLGRLLNVYKQINGINLLLLFLRVIKIFSFYITPMRIILNTINSSVQTLFAYFLFFFSIVLGFSVFCWLYYGRNMEIFSSLNKSFNENFSYAIGLFNSSETLTKMFYTSNEISWFYFLLVGIMMSFIIDRILTTVLIYYYRIEYLAYENEQKEKRILCKDLISPTLLMRFTQTITCKCWKNKRKIKQENITFNCECTKVRIDNLLGVNTDEFKMKKNINELLLEQIKDIECVDMIYTEDFELNKRDKQFESIQDRIKAKKYYEMKYRKILINIILYIIFTGTFIVTAFYNIISPWNYNFESLIRKSLNSKCSFTEIKNAWSLSECYLKNYTNIFTTAEFKKNKLIGNSLLVTFDIMNNNNKIQKKPIKISNDLSLQYSKYQSCDQKWGYYYLYNISSPFPIDKIHFFPSKTSKAFIEFMINNPSYSIVAYAKISTYITDGGNYENYINIGFVKYDYFLSPFYIIKFIFEIITLGMFFYIIIHFISNNILQWKKYSKWYYETILPLNSKIRFIRQENESETIRQLKFVIFTNANLCDIIIMLIFLSSVALIIILWVKETSFYSNAINIDLDTQINNIYAIRNSFYTIDYIRKAFTILSCIEMIILSIRIIIDIVKLGNSFKQIFFTFKATVRNIPSLILIIILIHPCFFLYTYITLGEHQENYKNIGRSILSLLRALFGYIELNPLTKLDPFFGCFLYYFYLIMVNLILVNFFYAIIFSSYINVRKKNSESSLEEFNLGKVLCCCDENAKENLNLFNQNQKSGLLDKEIISEFDYEKQIKLNKDIEMIPLYICKNEMTLSEWLKYEISAIKEFDRILYEAFRKKNNADKAYQALKRNIVGKFDNNRYSSIKEYQYHSFNVQYINICLEVREKFINDIIRIMNAINMIKEKEKYIKSKERKKIEGVIDKYKGFSSNKNSELNEESEEDIYINANLRESIKSEVKEEKKEGEEKEEEKEEEEEKEKEEEDKEEDEEKEQEEEKKNKSNIISEDFSIGNDSIENEFHTSNSRGDEGLNLRKKIHK